jgi:ferredoxin-NADP reductase
METHILKVKAVSRVTHNVLRIVIEKPSQYNFKSGQATDVSINKPGWQDKMRPFTFTCLPEDDHLEFTIKTYPSHKGVTNELLKLNKGDELIITDSWGAIDYQGEGTFIAGGAGVTPFISILRNLHSKNKMGDNKLIFANDKEEDIINKEEFENILGDNFINILSQQKTSKYAYGYITETLLKKNIPDFSKFVYLCGPPSMMEAVEKQLANLNVPSESIIKEK